MIVVFDAELWIWDARRVDSWTFVTLPAEASEEISDTVGGRQRGFGSIRVRATVGGTTWTTSKSAPPGSTQTVPWQSKRRPGHRQSGRPRRRAGVGETVEFDTQVPHWFGSTGEEAEVLSIFGRPGERMHVRADTEDQE